MRSTLEIFSVPWSEILCEKGLILNVVVNNISLLIIVLDIIIWQYLQQIWYAGHVKLETYSLIVPFWYQNLDFKIYFCTKSVNAVWEIRSVTLIPVMQWWETLVQALAWCHQTTKHYLSQCSPYPDSKVHGANMRPIWVLSAPDGSHVGPMNLSIRVFMSPYGITSDAIIAWPDIHRSCIYANEMQTIWLGVFVLSCERPQYLQGGLVQGLVLELYYGCYYIMIYSL